MSDSDDSESFLSADEGGVKHEGDSSDITLSSDSEQGDGEKPKAVDLNSSDITLSSDDDDQRGVTSAKTSNETTFSKLASVSSSTDSTSLVQKQNNESSSKCDNTNIPCTMDKDMPSQQTEKAKTSGESFPSQSDSEKSGPALAAVQENIKTCSSSGFASIIEQSSEPSGVLPSVTYTEAQSVSTSEPTEGTEVKNVRPKEPLETGWSDFVETLEVADNDVELDLKPDQSATIETVDPLQKSLVSEAQLPEKCEALDASCGKSLDAGVVPLSENKTEPCDDTARPSEPPKTAVAERPRKQRPERRERRGPMKLGAKKLGVKVATPEEEHAEPCASTSSPPVVSGSTPVAQHDDKVKESVRASKEAEEDGWGGWESWGTSLLSSARDVTKTLVETVETGFGAPDPEELARITHQQQAQEKDVPRQETTQQDSAPAAAEGGDGDGGGLGGWFGGVSRVLGHTSSLVVNTGLDTLEAIGKKTMDVLQDDQLGIHDTIKGLGGGGKPCLSQALREARQKRGDTVPGGAPVRDGADTTPPTFSRLFDQCQGTVHLEALEMLSGRTQSRVASTRARCEEAAAVLLDMIEDACSAEAVEGGVVADDFESEVNSLVSRLHVPIKPSRLLITRASSVSWLGQQADRPATAPTEVLGHAVHCSADLAAGLAAFCHKMAELLLLPGGDRRRDGVGAARSLARLGALVSGEAGALAARHAELLSAQREERAAAATTDIYLEASYMQQFCTDALRLMVPVLQMTVLEDKST